MVHKWSLIEKNNRLDSHLSRMSRLCWFRYLKHSVAKGFSEQLDMFNSQKLWDRRKYDMQCGIDHNSYLGMVAHKISRGKDIYSEEFYYFHILYILDPKYHKSNIQSIDNNITCKPPYQSQNNSRLGSRRFEYPTVFLCQRILCKLSLSILRNLDIKRCTASIFLLKPKYKTLPDNYLNKYSLELRIKVNCNFHNLKDYKYCRSQKGQNIIRTPWQTFQRSMLIHRSLHNSNQNP